MQYVGLDVHKRSIEACFVDAEGNVVKRCSVDCTRDAIEMFVARALHDDDEVVLEATTNTWPIVDLLEPHVARVVVSNPLKTRAIAEARIKTDKVDAQILAQLLRTNFLPEVWHPDAQTRLRRRVTTRRATLVQDRTRLKNRIHAVLAMRLIKPPVERLFSNDGLEFLQTVELDDFGRKQLDSDLRMLELVEEEIALCDHELNKIAYAEAQVRLLMTMPGVGAAVALGLVAALGDISRFDSGAKAAAYLGLVPSTKQSANNTYHGRITKEGRSHTRWLMVQAAQHVSRHPGPLGHFFRKLSKRKNRNVAVVATARKMVVIAWHMLKHNEPYRYSQPKPTEAKMQKLRVAATGKTRKRGTSKGTPRPKSYGSGVNTTIRRSIDQVLEREGVPPIQPLAAGEQRMVAERGLEEFVEEIHTEKRVPKKRKPKAKK